MRLYNRFRFWLARLLRNAAERLEADSFVAAVGSRPRLILEQLEKSFPVGKKLTYEEAQRELAEDDLVRQDELRAGIKPQQFKRNR